MAKIKIVTVFLFVCLFLAFWFPRLYDFSDRFQFRYDQGVHLLETYTMVQSHKISLIGPMVTSKSYAGRNFFIGPQYYYLLAIISLIVHWNPPSITLICTFLDFVVLSVFSIWLSKKVGLFLAALFYLQFALSPFLIMHSFFIWNPHWLFPLGLIFCYFLNTYFHQPRLKSLFMLSFIWGLAFSFHYAALLFFIPLIVLYFVKKHFPVLSDLPVIVIGFIIGDLPFFIFELRHQFYNFKTMFYIFFHTHTATSLSPHYFFYPLFPVAIFCLILLARRQKVRVLITISLIIIMAQIPLSLNYRPLDIIPGWNYQEQQAATRSILAQGCPLNYNIAATNQGDTRAYDLRYLLTIANCPPLAVDQYPVTKNLYLITPLSRSPEIETVWEVATLKPFSILQKTPITANLTLYHLQRK